MRVQAYEVREVTNLCRNEREEAGAHFAVYRHTSQATHTFCLLILSSEQLRCSQYNLVLCWRNQGIDALMFASAFDDLHMVLLHMQEIRNTPVHDSSTDSSVSISDQRLTYIVVMLVK